ncbi:DUF3142 domain-containing protein [Klebsiella pneumoniae]|uniref:DUF3142 domain-containing protein n=1 Tax=Klebsiella pneumoniae TaxID=573 RepID=UPI002435DB3A|nr:DUF3142 domain-containing protein [Klebsiella pneumoniae]
MRVLGIQFHPQEGVRLARVNTSLLQQDGRPVWLVVRLDGSLTQLDTTTMLPQIKRLVTHWRKAGVNLTAIEIDYDAPTSRLSDYQRLLMAMRQGLPSDITLSITALPTWLTSPGLRPLLKAVDSSVLQLHSVQSPGDRLVRPDTGPALEQAICAYRSSPFLPRAPGLWFRAHRCPGTARQR